MKIKQLDNDYYNHQNSRSGMLLNSNELPNYYDKLDIQVNSNFYFLDIGCRAAAATVNFFYQKGAQSYGFDIGEEAQKVWKASKIPFESNLKVHDAHQPFEYPFTFDLISISHTLEHCYNPAKVLQNIKEALKQEGKVWGIVPIEKITDNHGPHYCNFHTHQEHLDIYTQAGFEVLWAIEERNNSYIVAQKK